MGAAAAAISIVSPAVHVLYREQTAMWSAVPACPSMLVSAEVIDWGALILLSVCLLPPPAGAASQPEPPPPLPEDQLAQLPVHVHRTPTKKGRKLGGSTGFTPSSTPRKGLFSSSKGTGGSAAGREPAAPPGCVPVLVEQAAGGLPGVHAAQQLQLGSAQPPRTSAWGASGKVSAAAAATAAADSAGSGGIKAARPTGPAAAGELGQEIVPAPAPLESEGSEAEEDEPLCSVCLEPFADGAKVRRGGVFMQGAQASCACLHG